VCKLKKERKIVERRGDWPGRGGASTLDKRKTETLHKTKMALGSPWKKERAHRRKLGFDRRGKKRLARASKQGDGESFAI